MSDDKIEIVGSTPAVPGAADGKVCGQCDGDGLLGDQTYGEAVIFCDNCDGRGGTDAKAVDRARQFSASYREALTGEAA